MVMNVVGERHMRAFINTFHTEKRGLLTSPASSNLSCLLEVGEGASDAFLRQEDCTSRHSSLQPGLFCYSSVALRRHCMS